jgi:hypothetical protein
MTKGNKRCPQKDNKATTNKAARKKDEKKLCSTPSNDESESNEHDEDENEDEQFFNVGAELNVYEAPEEDVVEGQYNALDNLSLPTRGKFMCGYTTDRVEISTVLLNDLYEALLP